MTALPRTADEIVQQIEVVQAEDPFGFQRDMLLPALPFALAAARYLKPGTTAVEWEAVRTADVEQVTEAAKRYLTFAMDKADQHRGISANRSVAHYQAWLWLLGKDDRIDWEAYPRYGAPILRRVAEVMGWQDVWDGHTTLALERMSRGLVCTPDGCPDGCGT
jgi:hypothetical protein